MTSKGFGEDQSSSANIEKRALVTRNVAKEFFVPHRKSEWTQPLRAAFQHEKDSAKTNADRSLFEDVRSVINNHEKRSCDPFPFEDQNRFNFRYHI